MGTVSSQFPAFKTRFKKRLAELQKNIFTSLATSVIEDTPRKTGKLQANWNFSVGQPDLSTKDSTYKATRTVQAQIKAGVDGTDKAYFLSNGLPYAQRIENGYSSQAPAGMLAVNMARFKFIVKEETAKLH